MKNNKNTLLSAIYSITKEVKVVQKKSENDTESNTHKRKRTAVFTAYNSKKSFCYHHSKPISKMIIYDTEKF